MCASTSSVVSSISCGSVSMRTSSKSSAASGAAEIVVARTRPTPPRRCPPRPRPRRAAPRSCAACHTGPVRAHLPPGGADRVVERARSSRRCASSSANVPPGRSSRATFAQPTRGSTQWNAVAENAASKAPAGSSTSSKRPRWNVTGASPTARRATASIPSPGSTASSRKPRCARSRVSLPVPQPTSSTRDDASSPAQATSTRSRG